MESNDDDASCKSNKVLASNNIVIYLAVAGNVPDAASSADQILSQRINMDEVMGDS
jgi:hypothetical protein